MKNKVSLYILCLAFFLSLFAGGLNVSAAWFCVDLHSCAGFYPSQGLCQTDIGAPHICSYAGIPNSATGADCDAACY